MITYSDNKPDVLLHLGDGNYYFNYDIEEVEIDERKSFKCNTIFIKGSVTKDKIIEGLIRERYSLSEELAIQRQRDTKPEEFEAYFNYCEECKVKAKTL